MSTASVFTQSMMEVASIRENLSTGASPARIGGVQFQPGRLQVTNVRIENLVSEAYGVLGKPLRLREQLILWPKTTVKGRAFDINANLTTSEPLALDQQRRVLMELLTTRFGLKTHVEQQPMEVYKLTMVKQGVLGRALKQVDFNCDELAPADHPKDNEGRSLCRGGNYLPGKGLINERSSGDMKRLTDKLETLIELTDVTQNRGVLTGRRARPVLDDTRLKGFFLWEFSTSDELSTALREWLGLSLEPAKALVDVIVIDDIRMPIPN